MVKIFIIEKEGYYEGHIYQSTPFIVLTIILMHNKEKLIARCNKWCQERGHFDTH